jgi:hypothetical protein
MTAVRESDLRSLERKSMYSIFAPLDADERLPRELYMESKQHRPIGRRELAGALWLPALFLALVVTGWGNAAPPVALGVIVLLFIAFGFFAMSGEQGPDSDFPTGP